jgi:hypothetical protein
MKCPGAAQSSYRTTRTGTAQSCVDRYVQMQHKSLVDETRKVEHRQRDNPGAAQAAVSHAPPSIAQATF